ncbi:MAG: site-2 protease family protein [Myxococcota bacterium]|nr:site-2 protease family protein [Myxococcota bacterium]
MIRPLFLFLLTVLSTVWTGGWMFSITLLSILVAHEMGHYTAARYHNIPASLPYFIPLPLPPLGTMGAVITMETDSANRNQLMDIGVAGPIAGFVVAVFAMALGVSLSSTTIVTQDGALTFMGDSLLSALFVKILRPELAANETLLAHPVWIGAWGGFLVTAINLLPMGQLDGGHILHALNPKKAFARSRRVFKALIVLGFMGLGVHLPSMLWSITQAFGLEPESFFSISYLEDSTLLMPWFSHVFLVWAIFGRFTGLQHPPVRNEDENLSKVRYWLAFVCLVILILTFIPSPLWVEGVWRGPAPS